RQRVQTDAAEDRGHRDDHDRRVDRGDQGAEGGVGEGDPLVALVDLAEVASGYRWAASLSSRGRAAASRRSSASSSAVARPSESRRALSVRRSRRISVPSAVRLTIALRPSPGSGRRSTYPLASRAASVVAIAWGLTRSSSARLPGEAGPPRSSRASVD